MKGHSSTFEHDHINKCLPVKNQSNFSFGEIVAFKILSTLIELKMSFPHVAGKNQLKHDKMATDKSNRV